MQVFVKVVEAASFSGAARQLDLANASVTSCIRNLEGHLGVTLLQRTTRHVRVTEDGAAYYDRCKAILASVDEAESVARGSSEGLRGSLRLEMPVALGHSVLAPIIADFARQHPQLRIQASLTNQVDSLVERGIDAAVRMDEVEAADLIARPICENRYVVCASPDFLRRHGAPDAPQALDPALCLGITGGAANAVRPWTFGSGGETFKLWPGGALTFNNSDALLTVAEKGGGFVYVLEILARSRLANGAVVPVLQDWETASRTFYLVYPKSRFIPPKVRALADFLAARLSEAAPAVRKPVRVRRGGRS